MKRILLALLIVLGVLAQFPLTKSVEAVSASQWDPGFIISDPVFNNSNSMTVSQIQAFLNGKVPACDTQGTQPYGGGTRADYGRSRGAPPPYTCLKDKVVSGKSAARIIYDAGKANNINPQVILATLQKENSLVTDDWPWPTQYKTAMGYGCPDSTPGQCDAEYHGFKNQVDKAAWQFRRYVENPNAYNFGVGTRFVRYSPNASCGGTNVNIRSAGTAALYNYTPYQPNPGAVAAYPAEAPCGAYGNRNFWFTFNDWFGSSTKGGYYVNSPLYLRGNTIATGDFDNDGFDDTAIGAPGEDVQGKVNSGFVNVIHGSASGPNKNRQRQLYQSGGGISGGLEVGDYFGSSLASGDFDNDGYADLAFGTPSEAVGSSDNAGTVHVVYGSASGLNLSDQQIFYQGDGGLTGGMEAGDMVGATLAVGDFNNDGRDDLAIGAPGEGVGSAQSAGVVNVIFGSGSGLTTAAQQQLYQGSGVLVESSEAFDYLGSALAAGDFNDDGRDDLAIGVMGEDHTVSGSTMYEAGSVIMISGSNTGLNNADQQLLFQGAGGLEGAIEPYDYTGASLAVGDFDNDTNDDLAIGSPGETASRARSAGLVNVIFGDGTGLDMATQQRLYQGAGGLKGATETSDFVGNALSAGDYNGDNFDDLAIASPGEGVLGRAGAGALNVVNGSASGITLTGQKQLYQASGGLGGSLEANDYVGSALFSGNINNDGFMDLIIGAAGEDVSARADAGGLNLIRGSGSGLNSSAQTQLYQSPGWLMGNVEAGDYLGGSDPENIFW